jgi:hypothetical protein
MCRSSRYCDAMPRALLRLSLWAAMLLLACEPAPGPTSWQSGSCACCGSVGVNEQTCVCLFGFAKWRREGVFKEMKAPPGA